MKILTAKRRAELVAVKLPQNVIAVLEPDFFELFGKVNGKKFLVDIVKFDRQVIGQVVCFVKIIVAEVIFAVIVRVEFIAWKISACGIGNNFDDLLDRMFEFRVGGRCSSRRTS